MRERRIQTEQAARTKGRNEVQKKVRGENERQAGRMWKRQREGNEREAHGGGAHAKIGGRLLSAYCSSHTGLRNSPCPNTFLQSSDVNPCHTIIIVSQWFKSPPVTKEWNELSQQSTLLQISEQQPSRIIVIWGIVHHSSTPELMRTWAYPCTQKALQKHIVKISGQKGLYCVTEAECSSYSRAAGQGAEGWHQHKDKNVMRGISKASFKAWPQASLYTLTLWLFNSIW